MIVKMSLEVIGLIILIAILRRFFADIFPRKTFIILWGIVVYRLLIPFTIVSEFNVHSIIYDSFVKSGLIKQNTLVVIQPYFQKDRVFLIGIWLLGAFIIAGYILFTHLGYRKVYQTALPIKSPVVENWKKQYHLKRKVEILQLDKVTTPVTYGIVNPVIVLPKSIVKLENTQIEYVLLHEYIHIQNFDILFK